MISINNINKYFNHHKKNEIHVINNTSIELPDKGLVVFLGPSGCGKTTLLNTIGGLDKVASGKIYINGERITKRSSHYIDKVRNINIGYVFQNYNLLDNETVFDNVAISLKMIGIKDKKVIKEKVNYVLEVLGLYRYRNRLACMLSGGERQRVGIARAIVKDPSIIIADEPTGNLDSSNTIEIMNIIKSISKERLVILVTHEVPLANFYADRIVEIEDGTITKDYENKPSDNLDYRIENDFYLQDFKNISTLENADNEINIFNDKNNNIKLTVVVKNNNIYIKSNTKNYKIEVVDEDSNIKFINDHYKKIDKSIYEKYEFNTNNIIKNKRKIKYSSIINPFTLMYDGLKKVFNYSILKKLLLIGFFGSGMFIAYSVSNMYGLTNINKTNIIKYNDNYYNATLYKYDLESYLSYEKLNSVDYILPNNSLINFKINYEEYYQTYLSGDIITGSLTSIDALSKDDIILGRMPRNDYEVVVDTLTIDRLISNYYSSAGEVGYLNYKNFLNKEIYLNYLDSFTIVGFTDLDSPSIYANKKMFIDMINASYNNEYNDINNNITYLNYSLINDLNIKSGSIPKNDYEVMLSSIYMDNYQIGQVIDNKINNHKLVITGFYENKNINQDVLLTNQNMVKYSLIAKTKKISIYPKNDSVVSDFKKLNLNITKSYDELLKSYKASRESNVKNGLIVSGIILLISFIEIFLIVRSSFLTRIKEIGIYRAIGVKKSDIYKMFFSEIFGITTIACVPGILFMSYCINSLLIVDYFKENYLINVGTVLTSIILVYLFNLIVGLIPVFKLVRHTPAEILARKDLD